MQAAALLNGNGSPNEKQVNDSMRGNICRRRTYPRIRAAIQQAATEMV